MSEWLQAYLFAWFFVASIALGSLANLLLQAVTGGSWAERVRVPLEAAARLTPVVAVLFVPILLGYEALYPQAGSFFVARSVAYLVIWSLLSWRCLASCASGHEPDQRRRGVNAAGLIVYVFSVSFAAVDWIGSLVPHWYSSAFGLVVVSGQMLAGLAFGIAIAGFQCPVTSSDASTRQAFNDLGNLLLAYVMTWAYLAFTQFLIIWAANLPKEIAWYLPRVNTSWSALGIFLAVFHFFVPLAILISRAAKQSPRVLGMLAATVLAAHAAEVFWLVVPSVRPQGFSVLVSDAVALLMVCALTGTLWWRAMAQTPREVLWKASR